ncbi:hypothetical protein BH10PLA2_BH10PLA2_23190 [soil metagenome]
MSRDFNKGNARPVKSESNFSQSVKTMAVSKAQREVNLLRVTIRTDTDTLGAVNVENGLQSVDFSSS